MTCISGPQGWARALLPFGLKARSMRKIYFISVAALVGWLTVAYAAEPRPKECDEAAALESMRESRIEAELSRRGISDPVEKILHRPEIEKQVDDRIRIVKDICNRLVKGE